ncbi:hypothetical protein GCM10012287_08330 [Streptomyces daqingensis]|uniref:Uncharacterized protein n=1 Tax=Streptomyces daqingensis TaxID=1472640 RepID=A0ABQ2LWF3_9ACTN|nr:hypothetical protein GCM10012287_08330 [Streptomyces daqingensis]
MEGLRACGQTGPGGGATCGGADVRRYVVRAVVRELRGRGAALLQGAGCAVGRAGYVGARCVPVGAGSVAGRRVSRRGAVVRAVRRAVLRGGPL